LFVCIEDIGQTNFGCQRDFRRYHEGTKLITFTKEDVMGAVLLIGLVLYFLPSFIGHSKKNSNAICVLNIFTGWTVIGWIISLVWATTKD